MKRIAILTAGLLLSALGSADNQGSGYLVEIGEGLSQSSHLCKLKGKATLSDVDKIDAKLHKWQDDNGVDVIRSRLTPLFVGASTIPYDFIAVDWMTWDNFGGGWDKFMSSSKGQAIFAEYNKIMDCTRVLGSVFPIMRKPAITTDNESIVTVNWCTKKDGVSQDSLSARHRDYRDRMSSTTSIQWWGIGYPSAGARKGQFPGEFYHWVDYPDMKAYAQEQNRIANNEGWKGRRDYYDSYVDCSGEILMTNTVVRRR
jgi:hypothetical protein|tara:strand:- start:260 stop:1030 length:771 start_codon:yes stop_codon:yes gene_type:complete